MEIFYKYLRTYRWTVIKLWAVYLISTFLNIYAEVLVYSENKSFLGELLNLFNASILILWILTIFVIIYNALYFISKRIAISRHPSIRFTELMDKYTIGSLKDDVRGGVSWGYNATVWISPDIISGTPPEDILLDKYDNVPFAYGPEEKCYADFVSSSDFQRTIREGNNLPRYMLTRYRKNYDKKHPLLLFNLKKTEWSCCVYEWGKDRDTKDARVQDLMKFKEDSITQPNSFTLHLIIETSDGNVLTTIISKSKSNDYPDTNAVSLGEQIEQIDFHCNNDYAENFVSRWVKRAVCEEFGLRDECQYEECFDTQSLCVLSLNLEADIVNYSLVCVIRLLVNKEQFNKEINSTVDIKEISKIDEIELDDIPGILLGYDYDKKPVETDYHPSSYLRLLLFYMHKRGYYRTAQALTKKKLNSNTLTR